jgi:hypothetical protein
MRRSTLDLLSTVRSLLGNAPNATVSDGQILSIANAVIDEIVSQRRPSELSEVYSFTTTSGTEFYELPDDLAKVVDVVYDGKSLQELAISDVLKLDWEDGEPRAWAKWSNSPTPPYNHRIRIFPVPDDAYELNVAYVKRHPQLIVEPSPTPILFAHGLFMALCEAVAEAVLLGVSTQEAGGLGQISGWRGEFAEGYRRVSRGISDKPIRVRGAANPKSRRRSLW